MPIDPQQVQAVFFAAAVCDDSSERAIVLQQQCGNDTELRNRVLALLKADDDSNELPPPRVPDSDAICHPSAEYAPGMVIAGRYWLREEIAQGGMGTVWVAQQVNPVRRQVAIKLIKPGMDSRRVLSRFEAERQALAMMDHPNIAKVFDGGLTDTGRPFFVMEYVDGLAITEYCDRARMTIPDRLKLFIQVCQAVHHAHQKGIIHRDLKPSNVLVSGDPDRVVSKVIDFGLAKAMHKPLTEDSLPATQSFIVGTPRYMSPEQAELNNLDIDTRTDVYSLGVILYELLIGATPLESRRFEAASLPEILRLIKEDEPSPPSSRLASSASISEVAVQRSAEPSQLRRAMRGDLDWIVMMSLEKDRSRRYESANDLARDLERLLCHEPIAARPPSTAYRFRKFARRNRLVLATSALLLTTLLVGIVVSSMLAIQATRAGRLAEAARTAEAQQRRIAQQERDVAERRRAQAKESFRQAWDAIDEHFFSMVDSKHLNVEALQPLRRELLNSALTYYRRFIDQHGDDPALAAELANAYFRIGVLTQKTGPNDQAFEAYRRAIRRYEQLVHNHPEAREYWINLALAHEQLGGLDRSKRRLERAEASYARALEIRQKLAQENPNDGGCQSEFASLHVRLGILQASAEQFREAEESIRQALEIYERLAKEEPSESAYRFSLADAYYNLAGSQCATGRLVDAERSLGRAAQFFEQLTRENRSDYYLERVAGASYRLGHVKRIAGQFDAARASYARALELYETLGRADPSSGNYPRSMGGAHFHLGLLQSIGGQKDDAIQNWRAALADFRVATELGYEPAGFISSRAGAMAMLGHWREAADELAKALDKGDFHWRPRCQIALLRWAGDDEAEYRAACNELVERRGSQATGSEAGAIATACLIGRSTFDDWIAVLAIARRAAIVDPENPVYLTLVGAARYRAGQTDEALAMLEQALPLHQSVEASTSPSLDPLRASRVLCETMLMLVYRECNDEGALTEQFQSLQDIVDKMKSTGPVYCDDGENWRVAFAVLLAERELARLRPAIDP
jgi:serine/threonine protein kinase/tetratricopeptide (TPR) repeat protein